MSRLVIYLNFIASFVEDTLDVRDIIMEQA